MSLRLNFCLRRNFKMIKKLTATGLALLLLLAAGCGKADTTSSGPVDISEPETVSSEVIPEPVYAINPLTGVEELENGAENNRPVAIMVNNINKAQAVQTGVGDADIVYETEVEGGITRLMAVYQDVSKVERIGSIRSARYAYIDLAMGHNAIYVHHGQDPVYAAPHLKDTSAYTVGTNNCGQRIKNGLASEHTLYTFGGKLWDCLKAKYKTEKTPEMWQNFASEDEPVVPTGGFANTVTVAFSNAQKNKFTYDSETELYTRISNGNVRTDYLSGETVKVKNVLILMTSIVDYPDGLHRKIDLTSGTGYYATNGTYTEINWSKGSASSPLKITNTDGSAVTFNAGNTWVCLASKTKSQPTFE